MTSDPDSAAEQRPARKRRARRNRTAPEQPEFLADCSAHAALQPVVDAFKRGDYATTRRLCGELLAQDLDEDVHDAAREMLRRLAPDRLVIGVLWGSFVLLVLIVLWAYGQR